MQRKPIRSIAAALIAAALFTGCNPSTPAPGTVESPGPSGDPSPSGTPAGNSTFVFALSAEPATLNAALSTNQDVEVVSMAILEPLVRLDREFNLMPGLAASWEANDTSTAFTFHLQEGVTWHDGEAFTSADVKFFFDEALKTHPLGTQLAGKYAQTQTPDDLTAIVEFSEPYGPFFEAVTAFPIIPEHIYAGTEIASNDANMAPIGTGAFKFESFTSGNNVTLKRNEEYWGKKPQLETLIYQILPDANARALAIQTGEVDLVRQLPLAQMQGMQGSAEYVLAPYVTPTQLHLFFNTRSDALKDPAVRKAIYRTVDRQKIVDRVYLSGSAEVTRTAIPNQIGWASATTDTDLTKEFAVDKDAARAVLEPLGLKLRIAIHSAVPEWASVAQLIQADLAEIGVQTEIVNSDVNVYVENVYMKNDFDLAIAHFDAYSDPSLGVSRAYVCTPEPIQFRNPTGVCDPAVDGAFEAASVTADRTARAAAFADASRAVADVLGTGPLISFAQVQVIRADKWDGVEAFTHRHQFDWSALTSNG